MVDQSEGLPPTNGQSPEPSDGPSGKAMSAGARVESTGNGGLRQVAIAAAPIAAEAKALATDLKTQDEILEKIFDHSPDLISLCSANGQYQLINCEWGRALGWSREDILAWSQEMFPESCGDPDCPSDLRSSTPKAEAEWKDFQTTTQDGRVIDTSWALIGLADGTFIVVGRDVTGRRQAEHALRQAEQRYRELFENTHEGNFQISEDGRILAANPALARMLGFESAAELIGMPSEFALPRCLDQTQQAEFKRQLDEGGAVTGFEHQSVRKDGRRIWISESVRAVRGKTGAVLYYEGTAQDINARKRAENKSAAFGVLARKLSEARTAYEAAQIIADTANELFGWDSLLLDLYDADHDLVHPVLYVDTIADLRVDVTPADVKLDPTAHCRRVIDSGAELVVRHPPCEVDQEAGLFGDSSRTSAALINVPVRHAARVVGILSVQSYTAGAYDKAALDDLQLLADHCGEALNRIHAEASLFESEERYRELFENARDAIYVHDLRGRYISVNHAAEELTGYPRAEIMGRSFADFVAPEHVVGVRDNLCKKLADESQTVYEVDILTSAGRRVPVEVNSRLIYHNGVAVGVQGTVRDLTERKHSQAALQNFSRQLMAAQEADRQRISRELHDQIGQVLTAVRINMEAVQRALDTPEVSSHIEDSIIIIDEALTQVRNMSLDLRPLHLDDFGLSSALGWYVDRYTKRSGQKTQFFDELPAGQPRLRRDLETACFRIAQEALTNVARHARASSVQVKLTQSNGVLLLTIEDDGAGFDVGTLSSAGANATLGVRGMEERAEAVGGRIRVESEKGKGTRICAEFPIARPR